MINTKKGTLKKNSAEHRWYDILTGGEYWKPYLLRKAKLTAPMIIFMVVYCVGFVILEHWNRLHYTLIHSPLDDMIPFCEYFVIPYFFWFLYMLLFIVYMAMYDEENYHKVSTFVAIGMGVFLIVSALFPNILILRPETMPRDNFCTRLCQFLYSIDTPTNVTPSIHVFNSLAVMVAVWHTDAYLVRTKISKIIVTAIGASICLATMFIKQHSVSDVIVATGLAIAVYILVYRAGFVFNFEKRHKPAYRPRTVRS